jgi:hypothetical protein
VKHEEAVSFFSSCFTFHVSEWFSLRPGGENGFDEACSRHGDTDFP